MQTFRIYLFLIFLTLGFPTKAQNALEKEMHKQIALEFETYYNNGSYEAIFELFSDVFKEQLPLEQTKSFFTNLKFQQGNIKAREFKRFVRGSFASYKTTFERDIMALNISIDDQNKINGLYIEPYKEQKVIPVTEKNKTRLILPFKEKWFVFWGGDTKAENYHVESKAQKGAFDFIVQDSTGKSYKTNGMENEDYYAFGKEIIAPCEAVVTMVVDGVPDNTPGEMNPVFVPGNTVVLKTDNDEYLYFAHLKKHSIKVKEGQKVELGDVLGLCGNSGNSSEPHLHFHIQNQLQMHKATGMKAFFAEIFVNGSLKKVYSPVQGETIGNMP
jgi:murein DD-endopeptidase MepM/ murein hydrolase activator NlpD